MTPEEVRSIRNKATEYAKTYLSHKYYDEYIELYQAYCTNRGVKVTKGRKIPPVDERLLVKADN